LKLNIGCGNKKIEGYQGVDKFKCDAEDYICDIENEKLSFSVGFIGLISRLIFKIIPKKYVQQYCFILRASTLTFIIEVL